MELRTIVASAFEWVEIINFNVLEVRFEPAPVDFVFGVFENPISPTMIGPFPEFFPPSPSRTDGKSKHG
jgi:hypothetical protein